MDVKFLFNVALAWITVFNFSEFKSMLSFRQQHDTSFGQSDLYYICRLKPTTFEICACPDEIAECEWKTIEELLRMDNVAPFVKLICRLLLKGKKNGFDTVDIVGEEMESWVTKNKKMILYHRNIEWTYWWISFMKYSPGKLEINFAWTKSYTNAEWFNNEIILPQNIFSEKRLTTVTTTDIMIFKFRLIYFTWIFVLVSVLSVILLQYCWLSIFAKFLF